LKEGRRGKLREGRSVEERIEKYVWSLSFFENTPRQVYQSYRKDNAEDRQSAANKRWQLLKFKDYSPPNNGNGSTRPKESLRKSLA
jgi:hypothetical protein